MNEAQEVNGYQIKSLSTWSQQGSHERFFVAKPNGPLLSKSYSTIRAAIAAAKSMPTCYGFMLPSGSTVYLTTAEAAKHPMAAKFC